MKYWDTSAVVPLLLEQEATGAVRTIAEGDPGEVRAQAQRLLRIHSLKAADALQLAAALVWTGRSSGAGFVTFDERLGLAARLEGFEVLP